ncbi:MAG TPA: quinoprotein dehydrogenase-associated putative ABC transporter substrate-binding protein [Steroidobacteraceae bacterium]|nr:quinoprotein dehydrogenase-associated putative ABC transporter substrate-binding protein [Steroidobacteraceae bacterium]
MTGAPRVLIATLAIFALGRVTLGQATTASAAEPHKTGDAVLTVCSDPNNLPFSNRAGEGFENRIARLVAHELNMKIRYVWWAQRRGFVRNTLKDARCDLWPGIATGVENVVTTRPYYRSTYVFVTRRSAALSGLTLDDARLRSLSIGVQMIGNDAMNTPPAHAIARRGVVRNIRGFMLYGNYGKPNPPARIVEAVAAGAVDVAMVWGPLAGYFASRSPVPLRLEPVTPALDAGVWPMTYDIAMGVRRNEPQLRERIEHILAVDKPQIDAILQAFHVPELPIAATTAGR